MKKKVLLFVAVLATLCCLLSLSAFAAEPSSSDEFGDVTVLDNAALNARNDYGYSEGDTARIVLQIPGTQTYVTYPMYYCFSALNDGRYGMQPTPDFANLISATGYEFGTASIIRLEIPDYFTAVSTNYTKTNEMANLKYIKCNENFIYIHQGAFSNNTSLETVIIEDNLSQDISFSLGSNAFANCSALTTIKLPAHLTSLGERGISYCNSLKEINIPARLSVIGTAAFLGCNYLETVTFSSPSTVTAINHKAFAECYSLNCDFILPSVTDVGSVAFEGAGKNENCYLNVSLPSLVNLGQQAFRNAGVRSLSLSSTLKYDSNAWNTFMGCTKLEYADLSMCTLEAYPACFFADCTNLKVVVLNDSLKTLGKLMFQNCTSLEFLYLPSGLTCLGIGDSWQQGAFYNCSSLYFVSEKYSIESFVTDGIFDATKYAQNKPARPDIYYFPETITDLNNVANPFRGCKNINPTIVFGKNLTNIHKDGFTFASIGTENEPKNVVFLGNVTNFYYRNTYEYISFYFVGSSKDTFTINNNNETNKNGKVYICGENGYYNLNWAGNKADWVETDTPAHIFEKNLATDATCTMPKMVANYCFCGEIIGTPETEGEALGHNYTGTVTYTFITADKEGAKCTVCTNGCGVDSVEVVPAVYTELGYSAKTFGNAQYSFTNGYEINRESLKLYEKEKGVSLKFGFAFNLAQGFTNGEVTLDSFALKTNVVNQTSDINFRVHEFYVNYGNADNLDTDIIIGAFVVENDGENESIYFINRAQDTTVGVNGFNAVSYNYIKGTYGE